MITGTFCLPVHRLTLCVSDTFYLVLDPEFCPNLDPDPSLFSASVADPYHFDTDPDPGCEKNRHGSGSGSRVNFDTDPDPVPGKNDTDPDPSKKD